MKKRVCNIVHRLPALLVAFVLAACTPIERVPQPTRNVSGGPERVFARPVAEFLPQLEGAAGTSVGGRVGNELVFWEYRLPDNSMANLFTCARSENVDCEIRINAICPDGGQELARLEEPGQVRKMYCTTIGIAQPGERLPNCQVLERVELLLTGLVRCR